MKTKFMNGLLFMILIPISSALAYECPIPPTSIDPEVIVKVDFDKKTGLYTYRYTLSNGPSALLPIDSLLLPIDVAPKSISTPKNWIEDLTIENEKVIRQSWLTAHRENMIKPGSSLSGFVLTSDKAPGAMPYYTEGDAELLHTVEFDGDEEASPDCPGYYQEASLLDSLVSGLTQGPVGDRYISVDIELKDSKGERECGPISPYEDKGLLNVLLNGKKDLEVKNIDLASITFGVGKAPIVSSRVIGKSNQILLQFDVQKVAIECGRDRVLVLRGKLKDGKELLGGAAAKTKNCDKRPKHKPPQNNSRHKGHRH